MHSGSQRSVRSCPASPPLGDSVSSPTEWGLRWKACGVALWGLIREALEGMQDGARHAAPGAVGALKGLQPRRKDGAGHPTVEGRHEEGHKATHRVRAHSLGALWVRAVERPSGRRSGDSESQR